DERVACFPVRAKLNGLTAEFTAYVDDSFSILGIVSRCEVARHVGAGIPRPPLQSRRVHWWVGFFRTAARSEKQHGKSTLRRQSLLSGFDRIGPRRLLGVR